jgi:phosphatidylinositol alpha-1,6-mannosyltransferase
MMDALARGLAPNVNCLTAVRADASTDFDEACCTYRREMTFSQNSAVQAAAFCWTLLEIAVKNRLRFAHLATVGEGYIGLHLKRRLGVPFLLYAHGNEIAALAGAGAASKWRAPLEALRAAHRVVAVSRETASRVIQLGVPQDSVRVVYPGCDVDLFRPVGVDPLFRQRILGGKADRRVILTVGNLVERKGHDVVIRSIPRIRAVIPDIVYVIVGDGTRRPALEQLATEVGVRDQVVFVGAAGLSELPFLYAIADVFVMASRTREGEADLEGFGLVYLEAAACRKAVIAGRAGGAPEAIVDGETGLLVDPTCPEAVGCAILTLLRNEEMRARMAAEGYRRVLRSFVWSRFCRDIEALMDEPAAEANGAARGRS